LAPRSTASSPCTRLSGPFHVSATTHGLGANVTGAKTLYLGANYCGAKIRVYFLNSFGEGHVWKNLSKKGSKKNKKDWRMGHWGLTGERTALGARLIQTETEQTNARTRKGATTKSDGSPSNQNNSLPNLARTQFNLTRTHSKLLERNWDRTQERK
jgi:hypothetical protein